MSNDLIRVAFLVQSVAIVVGMPIFLVILWKLVRLWGVYLDVAARQGALTKEAAVVMTERIIARVEQVPSNTATKVLEGQAAIPVPPAPRSFKDSVKMILAGSLAALCAGAWAFAPEGQAAMSPEQAIRAGKYDLAVTRAREEQNPYREVEALLHAGRQREAEMTLATLPSSDARANYLRALAARCRLDDAEWKRLVQLSASQGDEVALAVIADDRL